jgi:C-terminal processing protease CtpA/Prc
MNPALPMSRLSIRSTLLLAALTLSLTAASQRKKHPDHPWPAAALQQDFSVLQNLLETLHPSLHAYLPYNQWKAACFSFQNRIRDSLTTHQFLYGTVLPLLANIRCGHTYATYPKALAAHLRRSPQGFFPLHLKCWGDTMLVVSHLNPADSSVPRGSRITAINGMTPPEIRDAMFRFLPTDGYAQNLNYHRLSASFPTLHRNIFGLRKDYQVSVRTPNGTDTTLTLKAFRAVLDSSGRPADRPGPSRAAKALHYFTDTVSQAAVLRINSFDKRLGVRRFFRRSFRDIRRKGTRDLIVDIRNNGGGYVDQQAQLARYLKKTPFRVADTAAAVTRHLGRLRRYVRHSLDDQLVLAFLTRRQTDGKYHLRYWERKVFHPKKRNAFTGHTHVLISGPTFSAAALFAALVKGQDNITLLGEETGGGAYANNGLLLPECRLPNTGIRITLPLFRLVPDGQAPHTGRGVQPDVLVGPDTESVHLGIDRKLERVRKRIRQHGQPD